MTREADRRRRALIRRRRRRAGVGLAAAVVLGGATVLGGSGLPEDADDPGRLSGGSAQAAVRVVDGRATPTIPAQAANGPALPVGPPPVPLAVDLKTTADPVKVRFDRPPRAGLLFDLDTGEVLWRRNPTRVLGMASVTKIMTALLVDERVKAGAR